MTTELKVTIPTQYEQKSVDMLNVFGDMEITISIRPQGAPKFFNISTTYVFDGKESTENVIGLGERFIKENWKACLRLIEENKADNATKVARAAVKIQPDAVPDGSIG